MAAAAGRGQGGSLPRAPPFSFPASFMAISQGPHSCSDKVLRLGLLMWHLSGSQFLNVKLQLEGWEGETALGILRTGGSHCRSMWEDFLLSKVLIFYSEWFKGNRRSRKGNLYLHERLCFAGPHGASHIWTT